MCENRLVSDLMGNFADPENEQIGSQVFEYKNKRYIVANRASSPFVYRCITRRLETFTFWKVES